MGNVLCFLPVLRFLLETSPRAAPADLFWNMVDAYLVWAEGGPGFYYDELYRNIGFWFVASRLAGPLLKCGGWV